MRINHWKTVLFACLLSASALAVEPSKARQDVGGSATDARGNIALLATYGIGLDRPSEYGLGLGARIGYTFHSNFYLGGLFAYHFGTSVFGFDYDPFNNRSYFGSGHTSVLQLGAEGGYSVFGDKTEVRPYLGIGLVKLTGQIPLFQFGPVTKSSAYFALWPGFGALYYFSGSSSRGVFVGGDAHFTWLPSAKGGNAVAIAATLGYRF